VPVDYVTARAYAANGVYPRFFHAMLRRGVALAPGAYEVMFPGLSHGDDVLDRVVAAAGESSAEVAKELAAAQA
jgi:glutamate-1-semialdehyde 2,1-aminomutase